MSEDCREPLTDDDFWATEEEFRMPYKYWRRLYNLSLDNTLNGEWPWND